MTPIEQGGFFGEQTGDKRAAQAAFISDALSQLLRVCPLFQFELERFTRVIRQRARRSRETDDEMILRAIAQGYQTITAISNRTLIPYNTVSARLQHLLRQRKLDERLHTLPHSTRGGAPFELLYVVGSGRRARKRKGAITVRQSGLFEEAA